MFGKKLEGEMDMMGEAMLEADRADEKAAVNETATICVETLAKALRRENFERVTPRLAYTTVRVESQVPWSKETFVLRGGWRRGARKLIALASLVEDKEKQMSNEKSQKCYTLRAVDPDSDEKNALVWCVLDEHRALMLLEQLTMAVTRKTGVFEFQIGGKLEESADE